MKKANKLKSIMLVDDNPDDNYFHQIIINNFDKGIAVTAMESAIEALDYLLSIEDKKEYPSVLFLDINMPKMNGWEFLDEYCKHKICEKSNIVLIILSTSDNDCDIEKAKTYKCVSDFKTKPLKIEILEEVREIVNFKK